MFKRMLGFRERCTRATIIPERGHAHTRQYCARTTPWRRVRKNACKASFGHKQALLYYSLRLINSSGQKLCRLRPTSFLKPLHSCTADGHVEEHALDGHMFAKQLLSSPIPRSDLLLSVLRKKLRDGLGSPTRSTSSDSKTRDT